MISLKTGSRRVVANVENPTVNADKPKGKPTSKQPQSSEPDDPVAAAQKQTAAAQEQEEQATAQKQLADAHVKAKAISDDARSRSKDAYDEKPNSKAGKDAHAKAAMAHGDAATAYGKLASAGSGNDIDTRAKCQTMADKHTDMKDRHDTIAEGMSMGMSGKSTLNYGSAGVVANVGRNLGKPINDDFPEAPLLTNVWSDAAREASAAARSGGGGSSRDAAEQATDVHAHAAAAAYHTDAPTGMMDQKTQDAHATAAGAHQIASSMIKRGAPGAAKQSTKARSASVAAHKAQDSHAW